MTEENKLKGSRGSISLSLSLSLSLCLSISLESVKALLNFGGDDLQLGHFSSLLKT